VETGKKNPPNEKTIRALARILKARGRLAELLLAAQSSRKSIRFEITPLTEPDIARALFLLNEAYADGRLDGRVARRIVQIIEANTAAA